MSRRMDVSDFAFAIAAFAPFANRLGFVEAIHSPWLFRNEPRDSRLPGRPVGYAGLESKRKPLRFCVISWFVKDLEPFAATETDFLHYLGRLTVGFELLFSNVLQITGQLSMTFSLMHISFG